MVSQGERVSISRAIRGFGELTRGVRDVWAPAPERSPAEGEAWVEAQLKALLCAMASPPEALRAAYPPFVCVGCDVLEDLATLLPCFRAPREATRTETTLRALDALDRALEPLNAAERNSERVALEGPEWSLAREGAQATLDALGWVYEAPEPAVEGTPGCWHRPGASGTWVGT